MAKEGIILVNKPQGLTSHDVVDIVRKKLHQRRIGHAGTLDPLATGLLIILVGRYTKFFSRFVDFSKEYTGKLKLGEITDTGDSEGKIIKTSSLEGVDDDLIKKVFLSFQGEKEQIPPMVSALRLKGRRLYELARKGIVVERKPRKITIYSCKVLKIEKPFVEFYIHCSKGTYIRKIAEDIGNILGCGAHIVGINRLSIGPFNLKNAVNIDRISPDSVFKPAFKI